MKSYAPIRKLEEILCIESHAERLRAFRKWCDNHVAQCFAFVRLPEEVLASHLDAKKDLFRHDQVARHNIAKQISDLVVCDEKRKDLQALISLRYSLCVIVPEGVEHPRKAQHRAEARVEPSLP